MCTRLPNPLNGQVSTDNPPTFGSLASYTCDDGFQLIGAPSRMCQESLWSEFPPECVRKWLKLISIINHNIP